MLAAAIAGIPMPLQVTAKNEDGSTIAGYTGTVHFSSSDALAGLPADYTFTTADNGTHLFLVTLRTAARAQTVTVTDVNGPALGQSGTITGTSNSVRVIALPRGSASAAGVLINQGLLLQLLGTALANALIKIIVHSDPIEIDTTADAAGNWSVAFDTSQIDWGDHTIYYEEIDPDGTDSGLLTLGTLTVADVAPPTSTESAAPAPNAAGWNSTAVTVTVSAVDQAHGSQVKEIHLSVDGVDHVFAAATATLTVSGELRHNVTYWAVDNAGNSEAARTVAVWIDQTAPVTTAAVSGTTGSNGWWKAGSPTLLTLTAIDNLSGVAATYFRADGGPTTTYAGPITLPNGVHIYQYWSVDSAGNVEGARTILLKVDRGQPVVTISGVSDGARYMLGTAHHPSFSASDSVSGIASSSSTLTPPGTASGAGAYTFSATATDLAGNTTTVTVHYAINYFFNFITPLPPGPSLSAGQTLAVRIQLFNSGGASIGNGVARLLVDGAPATPARNFNTGNLFRYQQDEIDYFYRLDTTGLATGQHLLTVTLDDGTMREMTFSIGVPAPFQLGVSPISTQVGRAVTISGTHYAPGSLVTIRFNGVVIGQATANATGSFSLSVTIPLTAPLGTSSFVASGIAVGGAPQLESRLIQLTG